MLGGPTVGVDGVAGDEEKDDENEDAGSPGDEGPSPGVEAAQAERSCCVSPGGCAECKVAALSNGAPDNKLRISGVRGVVVHSPPPPAELELAKLTLRNIINHWSI